MINQEKIDAQKALRAVYKFFLLASGILLTILSIHDDITHFGEIVVSSGLTLIIPLTCYCFAFIWMGEKQRIIRCEIYISKKVCEINNAINQAGLTNREFAGFYDFIYIKKNQRFCISIANLAMLGSYIGVAITSIAFGLVLYNDPDEHYVLPLPWHIIALVILIIAITFLLIFGIKILRQMQKQKTSVIKKNKAKKESIDITETSTTPNYCENHQIFRDLS